MAIAKKSRHATLGVLSLILTAAAGIASAAPPFGHREVLDDRYHHGHFYPQRGAIVRVLPAGYRPYWFHGVRYYFVGGIWYAPAPGGFVVVQPPAGVVVSVLPPYYTTVWLGGMPYYYADDIYYRWDPIVNGYEVVEPPPDADRPGTAPSAPTENFYIYPKSGQSPQQQAADRYECHSWATQQTGFDPTQAGGSVPPPERNAKRAQYRRAMAACLEGRGYSVE